MHKKRSNGNAMREKEKVLGQAFSGMADSVDRFFFCLVKDRNVVPVRCF
jgi:hypothetical protein